MRHKSFHEYIFLVSANDVMEHFAFPGNIDFAADDQGASCIFHERLLCLLIVCETMFIIGESRTISHPNGQMTQNCKHSKCLQILAEEDFPLKLLWRTPIKIHRRVDQRRQPRSREHRFSTAKAKSSTQRPQTSTEAATKYYNYIVIETDEEREHRLPTLPKATRLDQATLKVNSQNYLLRCSDRQQELCTSRISFQRLGTADQPLHHEQQWVLQ